MSDIVSDDDLSPLAAEYVLGTLDSDERTRANVLLDVDHQFRGMVRIWERRLGELHLMVEPVDPDPKIWERIRDKLKDALPPAPVVAAPPEESKAAEPKPPTIKLFEVISADAKPADVKPADVKPADAKPADVKPADVNLADIRPFELKPAEAKSTVTTTEERLAGLVQEVERIAESAKSEAKAADAKADAAEARTADAVEAYLFELKPAKDGAAKPEPDAPSIVGEIENELAAITGASAADPKSAEPKSAELTSAGLTSDEPKTNEPKPDEPKLDEPKPDESKPGEVEPVEARLPERGAREIAALIPERHDALRLPDAELAVRGSRGGGWRAYSALMTLVAIGLGGLIAAWRYVPEKLPPQLRPTAVLNIPVAPPAPVKKSAPPESQFDE